MSEFPSKVDAWFMLLFWGGALAMGAGAFPLWRRSRAAAILVGAIAILFAGISYTAQSLKYVVADDGVLYTRGGLLPGGPIAEIARITKIEPSTDSRSAPAASLHRLRVDWDGGSVLISPDDKEGFLAAVARKNPALHRDGPALVR